MNIPLPSVRLVRDLLFWVGGGTAATASYEFGSFGAIATSFGLYFGLALAFVLYEHWRGEAS